MLKVNSPEYQILYKCFQKIQGMDKWIASVVETYIYSEEKEYFDTEQQVLKRELLVTRDISSGQIVSGHVKNYITTYTFPYYTLESDYWLRDKKLHGEYKLIRSDSSVGMLKTYNNGVLHGEYKEYHENNIVNVSCMYHQGKLHGLCYSNFDSGQLCDFYTYTHGKRHGDFEVYYKNGVLAETGSYFHDKLSGEYTSFTTVREKDFECKRGKVQKHCYYDSDGCYHGEYTEYTNGTALIHCTYVHGKLHGEYTEYWNYSSRTIYIKGTYIMGKKDGYFTRYCECGQLDEETIWDNGIMRGQWKLIRHYLECNM